MKNIVKALYKNDPKLAKEVAKVLGYKIKVKAEDRLIEDLEDLEDAFSELTGVTENIKYGLKGRNLLKQDAGKQFLKAVKMLSAVRKEFKAFSKLLK